MRRHRTTAIPPRSRPPIRASAARPTHRSRQFRAGRYATISTSGKHATLNTRPLFKLMVEKKASDLFFTSNAPIKIKIEGQIFPVNKQVLSPETVRQTVLALMTPEQREQFARDWELDFALVRARSRALPRQRVHAARLSRHGAALHHRRHAAPRGARAARGDARSDHDEARPGADDRRHRLGQVDLACRDDQLPQRELLGPHRHHRGSRSNSCTPTSARSSTSAKWASIPARTIARCAA